DVVLLLVSLRIEWITGIFENDDVSALDLALRKKGKARAGRKNKFIDEQMIADRDRILHRAGGNLDGLNDKGHAKQSHDYRDDRRFEIFTDDSLGWPGRFGLH